MIQLQGMKEQLVGLRVHDTTAGYEGTVVVEITVATE